jgi:peptide/nickel transport system permease protein
MLLKKQDYVRYAEASGVRAPLILLRHIVPNILPVMLVATTLQVGNVILAEASLSFLGAGVPPPQASWGVSVSDGQALFTTGWWIALFAALAISVTVLSFNGLSDSLRDHLDPRLQT